MNKKKLRVKCNAKGCQNKVDVLEWVFIKLPEPFVLCNECQRRFDETNRIFELAMREKII